MKQRVSKRYITPKCQTQTDMPRFQMNKFPDRTVDIGINPLHIRITLETVKAFFGKLSAVRPLLGFREISCRQSTEFVQKKQSWQKLAKVGIAYNILTIFISLYFWLVQMRQFSYTFFWGSAWNKHEIVTRLNRLDADWVAGYRQRHREHTWFNSRRISLSSMSLVPALHSNV